MHDSSILKSITFTLAALTIGACGDSSGETTVVTTVITSNGGTDTPPFVTTGDDTSTSSSDGDETETSSSTGDELTTSAGPTTAYVPPEHCIKNDNGSTPVPTCETHAATWCDEVADFAGQHLPDPYDDIAVKNCEAIGNIDPCAVCFYIANTCAQVSGPCDEDLVYVCGCLAQAHGAL